MSDTYLPYESPATTNFKLDAEALTVGVNGVVRERIQISGATALQIAPVDATAGLKVDLGADNDVTVTSISAGDNNIGNVDIVTVPAPLSTTGGGTEATALRVTVASDSTGVLSVDDNGGSLTIDAASLPLPTGASTAAKQPALGTAGTASTDVITIQGIASMTKLLVTPDSVALPANQSVNVAQINGVAPTMGNGASGTGVQRVTVANDSTGILAGVTTVTTVSSVTQNPDIRQATASNLNAQTVGSVAHDGVDSGNPHKIGAVAIAHGTNPTAVAAADRTNLYANRAGIPFFIGGHPNIVTLEAAYTAAQTDTAIVTVAGGLKIVVTQIQMTADNANTVDVGFRVGFAAANTPTTTGVVLTHPGVAAGSGISRGDGSGIIGVGADGEDLRITSEVPTTGSIRILVSYFTIES